MAFDEFLADRIKIIFKEKKVSYDARKMMGGLCFMVDGKMCCGIHYDKKKEMDLLMARIGENASKELIERKGALPMDFTGRPMKGYLFISPEGFDLEEDLEFWIQKCIDHNPDAKASPSKKKNK